jgi:acyl-CoA reductase-like NAD-dependent aldehyde dehydrogenase
VAREANSTIYGLSGSVWTRDISKSRSAWSALIDSGQVSGQHARRSSIPPCPSAATSSPAGVANSARKALDSYLKTKATTVIY